METLRYAVIQRELVVQSSLKTKRPIPDWAAEKVKESWNVRRMHMDDLQMSVEPAMARLALKGGRPCIAGFGVSIDHQLGSYLVLGFGLVRRSEMPISRI
jgi:hypothetical protein